MLIARCVEEKGQGARTDLENSFKVSAKVFSDHSDLSHPTVLKYLRTWDAMALAGIVPPREELEPGEGQGEREPRAEMNKVSAKSFGEHPY